MGGPSDLFLLWLRTYVATYGHIILAFIFPSPFTERFSRCSPDRSPPPLTRAAGLLDRIGGNPPAIAAIASELEKLGYAWAQRTVRVKRGGGGGGG